MGRNDISKTLRQLVKTDTDTWKPTLRISSATDPLVKLREDQQYEAFTYPTCNFVLFCTREKEAIIFGYYPEPVPCSTTGDFGTPFPS